MDKSIIFYDKDNNNNYIKDFKFKTLYFINSIFQTKDNEIYYSDYQNSYNTIYFYYFLQKKVISKLNNINYYYAEITKFILISKELLFILVYYVISIININEHNLIKTINMFNENGIQSVCMLNKNILITGGSNGAISQ